jgi:hypothetical protein
MSSEELELGTAQGQDDRPALMTSYRTPPTESHAVSPEAKTIA